MLREKVSVDYQERHDLAQLNHQKIPRLDPSLSMLLRDVVHPLSTYRCVFHSPRLRHRI
jgi:hypothetical protein